MEDEVEAMMNGRSEGAGLADTNPLPISGVHNTAGGSMNKTAVINDGIAQDGWVSM